MVPACVATPARVCQGDKTSDASVPLGHLAEGVPEEDRYAGGGNAMGEVVPLRARKGTAREQLLALAQQQARVQGKSLLHYLKELQAQVEHTAKPQPVAPRVPREKYTYL